MTIHSFTKQKRFNRQIGETLLKLFFKSLKDQTRIRAAETETVRKHIIDFRLTRLVRNVIQIAIGIGKFVIDGRRQNVFRHRQNRKDGFDSARRAERVSGH